LASLILISADNNITVGYNEAHEPKKLVVIGNIQGESYRQEFHSDEFGFIFGEVLLSVDEEYNSAAATFLLQPNGPTSYTVSLFESDEVVNFTALSLEVYR